MKNSSSIFKTFRFWFATLAVVYFVAAVFILPYIVKNQTLDFISNNLKNKAALERVSFNPFGFEIQFYNFKIYDKNDEILINFEKLRVDFDLITTLLTQVVNFDSLSLYKPTLNLKLSKDGKINLLTLIPEQKSENNSSETKNAKSTELFPINLNEIKIENTKVLFTDYSSDNPFSMTLFPLNYTASNISTVLNEKGKYIFDIKVNNHTQLNSKGSISINPIKVKGDLFLSQLHIGDFWSKIEKDFNFYVNDTIIDLDSKYNINYLKDELSINLTNTNAKFTDFAMGSKEKKKDLITLKALEVKNVQLSWPQQILFVENIILQSFYTDFILNKNKTNNITELFTSENNNEALTKTSDKKTEIKKEAEWDATVKNIDLEDSKILFTDNTITHPFSTSLENINFNVQNIDLKPETKFVYKFESQIKKNTTITSTGDLSIKPLEVNSHYNIDNLHLNIFQSYLDESLNIDLKKADFFTNGIFKLEPNTNHISVDTNTKIKNIDIKHKESNENLITISQIDINELQFFQNKNSLKIKSIDLIKPYVKVHIDANKSTNFSNITKKSNLNEPITEKDTKKEEVKGKEFLFDLGPVSIKDGSMNFTDLSLPLPFQSFIEALKGSVSELSSYSSKPSNIEIGGVIDKYGLAKIDGFLDYKDIEQNTKINMLFKNIATKNLTPYSSEFIGRKIEGGKLTLDLSYKIVDAKLDANNNIIVHKIKLGDKIESKNSVDVPIDLAIALLEDSNGVIDLSLPITGNVNDPEFKIGSIVGQALTNMIVKIVLSPFSFLGNLLGIEGEELKYVEYEPGKSIILPPAKEKLDMLVKAFKTRPNLSLEINQTYQEKADSNAIKIDKFNLKLDTLLTELNKKHKEKDTYLMALESMYITDKKAKELEEVKKDFTTKKESKVVFEKAKYLNMLKEIQINKEIVTPKELELLAQNRSKNIAEYLIIKHKISQDRLIVKKLKLPETESEDKWIKIELGVAVKQK